MKEKRIDAFLGDGESNMLGNLSTTVGNNTVSHH